MDTPNQMPDPIAIKVLRAVLMHVPFDGWSDATLIAGATDVGVDAAMLAKLFPNGVVDAIALHSRLTDCETVLAFNRLPEMPQKVHLSIRALVLLRLELAQRDKDAVRRSLAILALPVNAKLSLKLLYETVDVIWRAAGQKDTSFSFYTKRATLAAVYSSTVLAWLADNSGSMDKTINFLDRRLANVAAIPKSMAPLRGIKSVGERFVRATLKNIGRRHAN